MHTDVRFSLFVHHLQPVLSPGRDSKPAPAGVGSSSQARCLAPLGVSDARAHRVPLGCLTALAVVMGIAGCATTPLAPAPVKPSPAASAPAAPAQPDDSRQASLAAVESFLERTQQYQSPAAAAPAADARVTGPGGAGAPVEAPKAAPDQTFANTQVALPDAEPARPQLAIPAVQSVAVRASEVRKPVAAEPVKTNTTNAPLEAGVDDAPALSEKLIAQLKSEAERSKDWPSQWRLRLTQLAFDRDVDAAEISAEIPEPTRSIFAALIDVALAVRNAASDPLTPAQDTVQKAEKLLLSVRDRADPQVLAVALCRKVVTFGVYDEMAAEEFVSGRSIQTIIYSEISNLHATQSDDGVYETRLSTRLEVLSAAGESLWQREEPEIVDRCRTRRTDFFLAQRVTLPPTLPAGDYVLKVFVEDKLANRAHESARSFTIASPVSVARGKP